MEERRWSRGEEFGGGGASTEEVLMRPRMAGASTVARVAKQLFSQARDRVRGHHLCRSTPAPTHPLPLSPDSVTTHTRGGVTCLSCVGLSDVLKNVVLPANIDNLEHHIKHRLAGGPSVSQEQAVSKVPGHSQSV